MKYAIVILVLIWSFNIAERIGCSETLLIWILMTVSLTNSNFDSSLNKKSKCERCFHELNLLQVSNWSKRLIYIYLNFEIFAEKKMHFKFVEESFVKLKESLTSARYIYIYIFILKIRIAGKYVYGLQKRRKTEARWLFRDSEVKPIWKKVFQEGSTDGIPWLTVTQQRFGNESHYK